ncbi:MAG: sterol desaturase family protein [Myxococcales bacterium]|nr:sterol desaturase family protein [Myxococcales bacterium]
MPRKVSHDDPTRLYKSDLIERLTRAHPYEPFFVFGPAIVALMVYAFIAGSRPWYGLVGVFLAGTFFWTFCEYVLHRYLFHYEAKSEFGKKQMKLIHGIHHQFPNDTDRLVIPPAVGVLVAVAFFGVYTLLFGWWYGIALVSGWVGGYMLYDWTHYSTHHRKPRTRVGRAARRRHLLHHYKYPDACYGVSTGFWDWVFGTTEAKAQAAGKGHHKPEGVWEVIDNKVT